MKVKIKILLIKDDINSNNFQFNFDKNLQFNDKDFGL